MSGKKGAARPGASLTDLLKEHAQIAEQEKQELESRLREKEDEERRKREDEERRQKLLLQQRLEEEKQRAQQRFQRVQERAKEAEEPTSVRAGGAVVAAPTVAPTVASSVMMHAPKKSLTPLWVAVTAIVVGGAAAGAYFLLLNDKAPALSAMHHSALAAMATGTYQAEVVRARYDASEVAAKQAEQIARLEGDVKTAQGEIVKLGGTIKEKEDALAAEAAKRAEMEAAAAAQPTVKRRPGGGGATRGGIQVNTGVFGGGTIVE